MATYAGLVPFDQLTAAQYTIIAQALSPNDNGRLAWDQFFPRVDVDSTKINEITQLDNRPVADRREWNAKGRLIPIVAPKQRQITMLPIESRDALMEQELNQLSEETRGNQIVMSQVIGNRIQDRVAKLAISNYRRIEIDAYSVWTLGKVTQRNPETGATYDTTFGIDSSRLQTASTAWNASGQHAYQNFLAWMLEGADEMGSIEGAIMRRATFNAILADAPNLPNQVAMTRTQIEDRITNDLGFQFKFYLNEQSLDVFNNGGTAVTRTKVFPAQMVAVVPGGFNVGATAFAPVQRAHDLVSTVDDAGIDVNGNTVYYESSNGGRQLDIECQLNALPIPNEQLLWTIDAGI